MASGKRTLDMHSIYNKGDLIDHELEYMIDKAERNRIKEVEIICGRGSGQLKKHVLKFLDRKDIKARYDRVKKDPNNFGRLFVYFRDHS